MSDNINYDKYNYFCYIGVFPNKDYEAESLILDTQTAIMLERFYYNPHRLKSEVNAAITHFLLETINKDRVPGFAIQEACWDRSLGMLNHPQLKRMELAITDINSWNKEKIIIHSQSNGIPYSDFVIREKITFTETLIPHLKSNPMLVGSYAIILKIHLMNYKKSKVDKFKLFREFTDFINYRVGIFHAVEFSLAVHYFLGNSKQNDIVQSLLKFGSKDPLGAILTSCWDLFFLRLLQLNYLRDDWGMVRPKLVSRDDALINLAKYSSIHGLVELNETPMPIVSFDYEGLDARTSSFLEELHNEIRRVAIIRNVTNSEDIGKKVEQITEAARELEEELISIVKQRG
ncbi:hypothetical protein [Paenibacillus graminis]|uniref:Uncharacterized protein n=1 Tax=Paenibacillus graminis TaxID=189425 RepID=A0A089M8V5_9BACL|nr:hypothetical protein [Paenibacillus graminis]AIQ70241.1 hypothetical protein PGRAT_23255 [Paenibacillus graminis]